VGVRDPLRDTMLAPPFAWGIVAGLAVLLVASEIDYESSPLRRAVAAPLGAALALATLLLVFGSGPGTSGVKVNLLGVQPVEAIRMLVVFAMAGALARRLDLLRALSEPSTPERPWLGVLRLPRWRDVRPVLGSMVLVLAFFFLQKDLGPALVLSGVVLALYAVARGRAAAVVLGVVMLVAAFAVAEATGVPATVGQRVRIWSAPWNNGVPGGNQVAHGLWAMASGAAWGTGPAVASPQFIPEGHTDFVIAAVGEQLGYVGVCVVCALYALLAWRGLRVAVRAPGDYSALLGIGLTLALLVQAGVIAAGLLGLLPLTGVVTPFLSHGRSSMLANCAAVGVLLAIARRQGAVREHLRQPVRVLASTLAVAAMAILGRAGWVQVVHADALATRASLSEQADGGLRFEYNPRLVAAARALERGSITDRHGLVIATSRASEIAALGATWARAGLSPARACVAEASRCYPLGGLGFGLLGDWDTQANWGARNASYLERERDTTLKGFDDHQRIVEVSHPTTRQVLRVVQRDYAALLPIVRHGIDPSRPDVALLLSRPRDVQASIDARLQQRVGQALRAGIERGAHARGAAVVIDVDSSEVLASVSYPWPADVDGVASGDDRAREALLDRARYGLYPPGSTFKLLMAAAALRSRPEIQAVPHVCQRLPGGRVGAHIDGWARPVRDDVLDTVPHGAVDLHRGLVVSCNAYFAQLAMALGPRPVIEAVSPFQIEVARPSTPQALRDTLPHAAYGQAQVLASPLKMARVASAIAAGGTVVPARWVVGEAPGADAGTPWLAPADAARLARDMREVVTSGTGRVLAGNATPMAGKTGTAEVDRRPAHSWFVGFAPYGGSRRIAFAVLIEHAGYGGRTAAPIAGDIVDAARALGYFR
jgi:cell division protein FtsW (lipid II flippase)